MRHFDWVAKLDHLAHNEVIFTLPKGNEVPDSTERRDARVNDYVLLKKNKKQTVLGEDPM